VAFCQSYISLAEPEKNFTAVSNSDCNAGIEFSMMMMMMMMKDELTLAWRYSGIAIIKLL